MTKAIQTEKQSWRSALHNFLITYRITPHTTTGKPPSELLMKRHLRTNLDLIRVTGQEETTVHKQQQKQKQQFDKTNCA